MINNGLTLVNYLASVLLLILLTFSATAQSPITGRDISMTPVLPGGTTTPGFTGTDFKLVSEPHVIAQGEGLENLLRINGILPDADAFGLVYDLNPAAENFHSLAAGVRLLLPKVVPNTTRPRALPSGTVFSLTLDQSLKNELVTRITAADPLTSSVSSFGVERFKDAADRTTTLTVIKNVNLSFGVIKNVIRGRVRSLGSETLGQVNEEAVLFQSILAGFAQPGQELTACDREALALIDKDLMIKRRALTDVRDPSQPPSRWREVRVVVRTLRAGDGSQVPNLRIFYVPEALYGRRGTERSFDRVSSPSERAIPEANYRVWAARGIGDPLPVSEVKRLEVRQDALGNPLVVDLIVRN